MAAENQRAQRPTTGRMCASCSALDCLSCRPGASSGRDTRVTATTRRTRSLLARRQLETKPEPEPEPELKARPKLQLELQPKRKRHKEPIKSWHYKQTGIRSRPIKLLTHPIEHIERKIIITYLLGFMFKFIAILTGPVIVLILYLITLPLSLFRRLIWSLLNLSFLCDARIKTAKDGGSFGSARDGSGVATTTNNWPDEHPNQQQQPDQQTYWNYCPMDFIETYWFKERLVNNVILIVEDDERKFCIHKLRDHLRKTVLARPEYRKFLSKAVTVGIPFYKSHYWRYLGLAADESCCKDHDAHHRITNLQADACTDTGIGTGIGAGSGQETNRDTDSLSHHQFSLTSSGSQSKENNWATKSVCVNVANEVGQNETGVDLRRHVYMDQNFSRPHIGSADISLASIRGYVCKLLDVSLDLQRPLWELRAIRSASKVYLIFRCHQSLADGKSLSKLLVEYLAVRPAETNIDRPLEIRLPGSELEAPGVSLQGDNHAHSEMSQQADSELKLLREKESFVGRMSEANSRLSAIFVGPLTVLLWIIWSFTRRKSNHLNKCLPNRPDLVNVGHSKGSDSGASSNVDAGVGTGTATDTVTGTGTGVGAAAAMDAEAEADADADKRGQVSRLDPRRFYMAHYDLTKFHQIKQMTRSTVSDVILCALSGALRDYLRKFNAVSNPPNLNISLTVDMRQPRQTKCNHEQQSFSASESSGAAAGHLSQVPKRPEVNCTLVNVPIPTSVEGTIPRLWDIRATMEELRTSADPWVMLGLQRFLFELLPSSWYRRIINYIALGNSSTFVSNIQGPQNMIESWCVDLFQRALMESRQAPKIYMVLPEEDRSSPSLEQRARPESGDNNDQSRKLMRAPESLEAGSKVEPAERGLPAKVGGATSGGRLELIQGMGHISAIYYCMQPPSSNIPISFNCITYHSKLFVASLSRSLLVEDSKLLIRLFFRQLDQLANSIARRRSLVTIVQGQSRVPIEVQPCSPIDSAMSMSLLDGIGCSELARGGHCRADNEQELDYDRRSESLSMGARLRSQLFGSHKDDLEADIGSSAAKCQSCLRRICVCRRRKSLFALDGRGERSANLMSLLRPVQSSRRSLSPQSASSNEMRSLEELREEDTGEDGGSDETAGLVEHASGQSRLAASAAAVVVAVATTTASTWKLGAPKRSTLSLDLSAAPTPKDTTKETSYGAKSDSGEPSSRHSDQWLSGARPVKPKAGGWQNSEQLIVPARRASRASGCKPMHSRSETDLMPSICRLEPRDDRSELGDRRNSTASWLTFVRPRKFSRLSKSSAGSNANQLEPAPTTTTTTTAAAAAASGNLSRNSFASLHWTLHGAARERPGMLPIGALIRRGFGGSEASSMATTRRRRSAAAESGAGRARRLLVMKDEINADVALRYRHQLENPLRGLRSRRFSTIVGTSSSRSQRRASLVPFNLIQTNKSLPRMFWDNSEETHV